MSREENDLFSQALEDRRLPGCTHDYLLGPLGGCRGTVSPGKQRLLVANASVPVDVAVIVGEDRREVIAIALHDVGDPALLEFLNRKLVGALPTRCGLRRRGRTRQYGRRHQQGECNAACDARVYGRILNGRAMGAQPSGPSTCRLSKRAL